MKNRTCCQGNQEKGLLCFIFSNHSLILSFYSCDYKSTLLQQGTSYLSLLYDFLLAYKCSPEFIDIKYKIFLN